MITPSLPVPATSFVGRNDELASIAGLLADPNCRLLTLLGPGGIGKTRLALQIAMTQRQFMDGAHFVPLAPIPSPDLLPSAIAGALQVTFYDAGDLRRHLINYLHEKQMLLVIDNFEHLLEGVDLLTDLLQGAPQVKFLVTSRERLNVQEEWVLALDGLSFPPDDVPLFSAMGAENKAKEANSSLESYGAVQLFAQRARQVQVNFSLDDNAQPVKRICRSVEGMPLALELAATWLRAMSCQMIASQIEEGLQFLTTPLRNVAERHRSLRAVVEQSWTLLTASEQVVLMRLAVFQGGFELEAAIRVAGASLEILAGLADKSLIRVNQQGRYSLHELLRQYAEKQLQAAGSVEAVRRAHSQYYLDFLVERDGDVKGRRQQAGLHEVRTELENTRAGCLWAVDHGHFALLTTAALDCLVNFGEMSSRFEDIELLLKQVEATLKTKSTVNPKFSAIGAENLGNNEAELLLDQISTRRERLKHWAGIKIDLEQLKAILERARRRGDTYEIAYCLCYLGDPYNGSPDYATKMERIEECLRLRRELGDDFYIAQTLSVVSGYYLESDLGGRVVSFQHEIIRIRRRTGDLFNLCYTLGNLSYFHFLLGNLNDTAHVVDEALEIQEEIRDLPWRRLLRATKGVLAFLSGDFDLAWVELQAESTCFDEQTYKVFRNWPDAFLSLLASMRGDYRQANELGQQSLFFPHEIIVKWVHLSLAVAACGLGENEEASRALHMALTSVMAQWPTFQRACLPVAAILAARANQPQWAAELLGLALAAPHELSGWVKKWPLLNETQQQLESQLGAAAFHAAFRRGQGLQLEAVARILIEQGTIEQSKKEPGKPLQIPSQRSASETANQVLIEPLSERELTVLRLIAAGCSNQEIAKQLVINITTVKKHVNHIFGKLDVQSRTQAIAHARALHLL